MFCPSYHITREVICSSSRSGLQEMDTVGMNNKHLTNQLSEVPDVLSSNPVGFVGVEFQTELPQVKLTMVNSFVKELDDCQKEVDSRQSPKGSPMHQVLSEIHQSPTYLKVLTEQFHDWEVNADLPPEILDINIGVDNWCKSARALYIDVDCILVTAQMEKDFCRKFHNLLPPELKHLPLVVTRI